MIYLSNHIHTHQSGINPPFLQRRFLSLATGNSMISSGESEAPWISREGPEMRRHGWLGAIENEVGAKKIFRGEGFLSKILQFYPRLVSMYMIR